MAPTSIGCRKQDEHRLSACCYRLLALGSHRWSRKHPLPARTPNCLRHATKTRNRNPIKCCTRHLSSLCKRFRISTIDHWTSSVAFSNGGFDSHIGHRCKPQHQSRWAQSGPPRRSKPDGFMPSGSVTTGPIRTFAGPSVGALWPTKAAIRFGGENLCKQPLSKQRELSVRLPIRINMRPFRTIFAAVSHPRESFATES
jgi:hypothetical protein